MRGKQLVVLFAPALVATLLVVDPCAAASVAAVDFDDGSGGFDATPDQLNGFISVSDWVFTNGAGISNDNNSQTDRASAPVGKFNGENGGALPMVGDPPPANNIHSFSITIPSGIEIDLTNISFDFSRATDGGAERWLAFKTSLDNSLTYSTIGPARPELLTASIPLSGAQYQDLTDTTVDFHWYAGGPGTGDIDIDSILIEGENLPVVIPGDVDGNGVVNIEDFEPIRLNFGTEVAGRSEGDLVADQFVDFADFNEFKVEFLKAGGSLADLQGVPEPSTAALLILCVGLCALRRPGREVA